MASNAPRQLAQDCGQHRPYRSKAEAQARIGWHLTCWKCKAGLVMHVWQCEHGHHHIGHRKPAPAPEAP